MCVCVCVCVCVCEIDTAQKILHSGLTGFPIAYAYRLTVCGTVTRQIKTKKHTQSRTENTKDLEAHFSF